MHKTSVFSVLGVELLLCPTLRSKIEVLHANFILRPLSPSLIWVPGLIV